MTWKEFKEVFENNGVNDETTIATIEVDYPDNINVRFWADENKVEAVDY